MSRRLLLAGALVALAALPVRAQMPFPRDLVPTRTTLGRLGLERHWMAPVPLVNEERLVGISLAEGFVFAQTNRGYFHAFDSESGRLLWTTRLGIQTARVRPASVNSFAVFVTNLNNLFALDRNTGTTIWKGQLNSLPSSATACDEERVMVGLASGKLYAYALKAKVKEGTAMRLSDRPIDAWNWQTSGPIETRPLPAGKFTAFGSDDGKVYVATSDEHAMLYRIATGGPIGAGLGAIGTRTLLIPSTDKNLYAVDLFTAKVLWIYPSGSAIQQEPLVAGAEIYAVNTSGLLASLDPETGSVRWSVSTQGGELIAVGAKRIYLATVEGDLFIIDRATGQTIADPRSTVERAGLNIRPYEFVPTNRMNDRLVMATPSGLILSLREEGQVSPRLARDAKASPFGFVPKEGALTPPPAPAAPPANAEKPVGDKPAAEPEKPAAEPPAGEPK